MARDCPIVPSIQTIDGTQPHAAICAGQDRHHSVSRQPLLLTDRCHGDDTETIEAVQRGDPDIAFNVFEEGDHEIAGEAIAADPTINPALMNMDQTLVLRADPEATVAIAEQRRRLEGLDAARQLERFEASLAKPFDVAVAGDEDGPVLII